MKEIKKYNVQLIHPFDPSIEGYLYQRGMVAEGNYYEKEIILFTGIEEEGLIDQLHYDAKEIIQVEITPKEQEQYLAILELEHVS